MGSRIRFAFALVLLAACATPRKINESNWMYELERNGFERKWVAFFNALDETQLALLGKVFTTGSNAALTDFERSLDDLKRFKFAHMVDAAMLCEDTRRQMVAKAARPTATQSSLFDKIEIVPGKPTHLPVEDEPDDPEGCFTPEEAYDRAFTEGQERNAKNPLPADRKDIEEISHRLHPFGFARFWSKQASELCVTAATLRNA